LKEGHCDPSFSFHLETKTFGGVLVVADLAGVSLSNMSKQILEVAKVRDNLSAVTNLLFIPRPWHKLMREIIRARWKRRFS
jgi:hypothetical protein